ncbi:MAG TPA: YdcF family protein [Myxococcaceae bacterium]|nr:YdcF family protein [Myxococcaceae bacterium]
MGRGLALFLGLFTLLNFIAGARSKGFDANIWWIDLRALPPALSVALLAAASLALLAYAFGGVSRAVGIGVAVTALPLLLATAVNSLIFWRLLLNGTVRSSFPVPFSLFVFLSLGLVLGSLAVRVTARPFLIATTVFACALGFPVAQLLCFGLTDYRRPADVAIVLGARAYATGHLSLPLAQRVRTGSELYREKLVPHLIFSGGPVKESTEMDEPRAMKRYAARLGVPESAVISDPEGVNTEATVQNTLRLAAQNRFRRLIVVSHFYHLPRIKMTYHRFGAEVLTVPAHIDEFTPDILFSVAREVPALWVYYLRALRL